MSHDRTMIARVMAAAGLLALAGATVLAQPPAGSAPSPEKDKPKQPPAPAKPDSPPAPPPAPAPAPSTPDQPPDELPGLDDLLGTKKGGSPSDSGDATKTDLARKLDAREMGDAFHQAVILMGDAASRLNKSKDTGATTQRVQDDIVKKLDLLIAQLEQNSQSSSKSPRSSDDDAGQQSQRQQDRRGERNQAGNTENRGEADPPARQDGQLRPDLDAARSAWGSLPERVRNMLLQGSGDRFSEAYKKMTEAYYRKLAEEGRK